MKPSFCRKSIFAVLFAALSLAGDEAAERNMGDDAFSRYDYKWAVHFYRNALEQADAVHWNENALLLARAQLYSGDIAAARQTFAEFQRRNPGDETTAGMFPGELMLAEKNYIGAARFFSTLAGHVIDPEENFKIRFAMAAALADGGEYIAAENAFIALENDWLKNPERAATVHLRCIETLIEGELFERAANMIAEKKYHSSNPGKYLFLELKLLAQKRDLDNFMLLWKKLPADYDIHTRQELARLGAEAAQLSNSTLPIAVELLDSIRENVEEEEEKKYIFRELINIQITNSPQDAATLISEYLNRWPDETDKAEMILRQARLYASLENPAVAVEKFRQLAEDPATPLNLRISACREAAAVAENTEETDLSERFLLLFAELAGNNNEKEEALLLLGELNQKKNSFSRAEEYFRQALNEEGIRSSDIRYRLLQSLMAQEKYTQATGIIEELKQASQREHRAAAAYYQALIASKTGKITEAREQFQIFQKDFPWSEHLSNAVYHAALLAFENRKFEVAAAELLAYARKYPQSPQCEYALLLASNAASSARQIPLAGEITAELDSRYPTGKGRIESRLLLAEALYALGRNGDARKQLDAATPLIGQEMNIKAHQLYQYARIAHAEKQNKEALNYLNELISKCPEASIICADAAFFAGNLSSEAGNYEKALDFYRKALDLKPSGLFSQLCKGRMADASYALYSSSKDPQKLQDAIEKYQELSSSSDYFIRLQSCFKLGRTLEEDKQFSAALEAYEKTLYVGAFLKRQKLAADPIWIEKAIRAALILCDNPQLPDRNNIRKRILNRSSELKISLDIPEIENTPNISFTPQEKSL